MSETVSAVPEALAAFDAAVSDSSPALVRHSRLLDAALARLARTRSVGLTAVPLDLGHRLGSDGRHLDDLGGWTGRVGAAFAAAGSPTPEGVVHVRSTVLEELLQRWGDAGSACANEAE